MAKDRFAECLAETLRWEGGYSNDPHDPGGPTMKGIIQVEYDAWRSRNGKAAQSVKLIADAEVKTIYRENYWVPCRCSELPPGIDLVVFDFAVNSGVATAIKKLQAMFHVERDGHMGSITLDAVAHGSQERGLGNVIRAYMDVRRAYLRALKTFWRFGKGWLRRCDGVETAALTLASRRDDAIVIVSDDVTEPLDDRDAQSETQGRASGIDKTSMWQSKTARAAEVTGGGSIAQIGMTTAKTAGALLKTGVLTVASLALEVLSQPETWLAIGVLAGSIFVWFERSRKMGAAE